MIIGLTIDTITFNFIINDDIYFIKLYIRTHNVVQLVNFPSKRLFSLLVTKGRDVRVARVRVIRDTTVASSQGIIARFLDILGLVQIPAGDGLLGYIEQNIFMVLPGLRMILHLLHGIEELLDISIAFVHKSSQVLLGIVRITCIELLTGGIIVSAIRVPCLL